jgi:hypothetical protein
MKTADLIAALAAEPPPPPLRLGRRVTLALVLGAAISAALFMTALGPRADFDAAAHTMRFDLKFVDTLALLLPSALLAVRLLRPEARAGALVAALVAPFVLLGGAVIVELVVTPADLWMTRLVGTNALHCLTLIPLMSIPPLTALIVAMRAGAPSHPALRRRAPRRRSTPPIAPTIRRCSSPAGTRWRRWSSSPRAPSPAASGCSGEGLDADATVCASSPRLRGEGWDEGRGG